MKVEQILENALDRAITREEALTLFEEVKTPDLISKLFAAASSVRQREAGNIFRLDGWMGSNTECKIDPPCLYCRRAVPGQDLAKWEIETSQLDDIAAAFKATGTTTVEIGGGTNAETSGPTVIEILRELRKSDLTIWVNVGPALEREHILEMKALGVESITSSFETMNEAVFQKIKPGDSLEKRKALANLISDCGVDLVSVIMVGLGESYKDRVNHLFYLNEIERFRWLAVSWLRIHPGGPLQGRMIPPSPIEAAKTVAIARLIYRDKEIGMSSPVHIQLSVLAGANRIVHAGASFHKKSGFSIGAQGFPGKVEEKEVIDGYVMTNLLPITARWIMDSGMDVEPLIREAIES